MPDDLREHRELQHLRELRARIDSLGKLVDATIAAMEHDAQPAASERARRLGWGGIIGGGLLAGVTSAAELARRAAKESPAMTAASAGLALMAVTAALVLPFTGDPPSEAAPRPSISAPASPSRPPAVARRHPRAEPRPEQSQRVGAIPPPAPRDTPPNVERVSVPVAPPPVDAPPVDPPPAEPPIELPAGPLNAACVADIRLLDLAHVRLLCGG